MGNDLGIVVGWAYHAEHGGSLVVWKVAVEGNGGVVQHREIVPMPGLLWAPRVTNSYSNRGYVCTTLDTGEERLALRLMLEWNDQQVWEVDDSRTPLFDVWSYANGINDAGTVCGNYGPDASAMAYPDDRHR